MITSLSKPLPTAALLRTLSWSHKCLDWVFVSCELQWVLNSAQSQLGTRLSASRLFSFLWREGSVTNTWWCFRSRTQPLPVRTIVESRHLRRVTFTNKSCHTSYGWVEGTQASLSWGQMRAQGRMSNGMWECKQPLAVSAQGASTKWVPRLEGTRAKVMGRNSRWLYLIVPCELPWETSADTCWAIVIRLKKSQHWTGWKGTAHCSSSHTRAMIRDDQAISFLWCKSHGFILLINLGYLSMETC